MMQQEYFVFPYNFEDLLKETTDNRYIVQSQDQISQLDIRILSRNLTDIEKALYDNFESIKENERFDFMFFWIKQIDLKNKLENIQLLEQMADMLTITLERILNHINKSANASEKNKDCFKMTIFLLFYFLTYNQQIYFQNYFYRNTCIKKSKNSLKDELQHAAAGNKPIISVDKKKKTPAQTISQETYERLFARQRKCLRIIQEAIEIDHRLIWGQKQIDEEYYKYYQQVSLKMLESRQLLKDSKVSEYVFSILQKSIKQRPDSQKHVPLKLMNILYEDEDIVDPLSNFIVLLFEKNIKLTQQLFLKINVRSYQSDFNEMKNLAAETVKMLVNCMLDKTNYQSENQAVKNSKEFLIKVCSQIPKFFYTNLSILIPLYDSEAYSLRNTLSEILGQIIKQVLTTSEQEEPDQNHQKMKLNLLDKLIERVYDKHAHSRSCVLGVLSDLCQENVIPMETLGSLLKIAADRCI